MDGYSFVYVSFLHRELLLYQFWNSSRWKKLRLGCKTTWFCSIQCYTQNETIPPKKEKWKKMCLFESGMLSRGLWNMLWRTCHLMGRNLAIGFLDKIKLLFFSTFLIYVYVCFVGNVAVSVWLVSVWLIIHTKLFFSFFLFITQIILIILTLKRINRNCRRWRMSKLVREVQL